MQNSDTMEYLRQQYAQLENEYADVKNRRKAELDRQLAVLEEHAGTDINPMWAGGMEALRGGNFSDAYTRYSAIPMQREAVRRKLMNDYLTSEQDDLAKLRQAVINRMSAKSSSQDAWMPKTSVVGGSMIEYNPNTQKARVLYENFRNSPLYEKIWSEINKDSLGSTMAFGSDEERRQYVFQQADKAFQQASSKDISRLYGEPGDEHIVRPVPDPTIPSQEAVQVPGEVSPTKIIPDEEVAVAQQYIPVLERELKDAKGQRKLVLEGELERLKSLAQGKMPPQVDMTWQGGPVPGSPTSGVSPEYKSARQVESEKQYFEKVALPEYEGDKQALSSMNQMDRYLDQMATILSSPNISSVSGPLHEQLTELGGFINYIDPDAKMSKAASSVPAYFGVLMDVVRDKIKALGSGTAVSNLDLIVSQKSLGDLRNTPEGNKILNGMLRLNLAEFKDRLANKVGSFDVPGGQGYRQWDKTRLKMDSTPSYTLRRNPNNGEYSVQSKSEWLAEMKAKFPKRTEKEILGVWKRFADDQTRDVLHQARKFTKGEIKYQGQGVQ